MMHVGGYGEWIVLIFFIILPFFFTIMIIKKNKLSKILILLPLFLNGLGVIILWIIASLKEKT